VRSARDALKLSPRTCNDSDFQIIAMKGLDSEAGRLVDRFPSRVSPARPCGAETTRFLAGAVSAMLSGRSFRSMVSSGLLGWQNSTTSLLFSPVRYATVLPN